MDHSQHTQKINGVEEKLVPLANGSFGREWDGDPDLQRTSAIQAFPARSGSATKAEQTRDCLPFRCFGEVSVLQRARRVEGHRSYRSPASHRRHQLVLKVVVCARRAERLGQAEKRSLGSSVQAMCALWVATELRPQARYWAQPGAPRSTCEGLACARCQLLARMSEEQLQGPEEEGHWPAGGIEDGPCCVVGRRRGPKRLRWSACVLGGGVAGCHRGGTIVQVRPHIRVGAPPSGCCKGMAGASGDWAETPTGARGTGDCSQPWLSSSMGARSRPTDIRDRGWAGLEVSPL